jgi:hypothetical protein
MTATTRRSAALPLFGSAAALLLAGCVAAGPQPTALPGEAAPADGARAAAVADIRARAAAAQPAGDPPVFSASAPGAEPTPDDIAAIEAELAAIGEAQRTAAGGSDLALLKRRAAALQTLKAGHAAAAEADIAASRAGD